MQPSETGREKNELKLESAQEQPDGKSHKEQKGCCDSPRHTPHGFGGSGGACRHPACRGVGQIYSLSHGLGAGAFSDGIIGNRHPCTGQKDSAGGGSGESLGRIRAIKIHHQAVEGHGCRSAHQRDELVGGKCEDAHVGRGGGSLILRHYLLPGGGTGVEAGTQKNNKTKYQRSHILKEGHALEANS